MKNIAPLFLLLVFTALAVLGLAYLVTFTIIGHYAR